MRLTPLPTRLVMLDRDGVINDHEPAYLARVEDWRPLPGALDAIRRLGAAGIQVAVCTNQSGVGRGLIAPEALAAIHRHMARALAEVGAAPLAAIHVCPHLPDDGCDCRKPRPGMLLATLAQLAVPSGAACFVGDSERDVLAARAAGCTACGVRTGHGSELSRMQLTSTEHLFDSLADAVDAILDNSVK